MQVVMITALKSLAALLILVSLVCGAGAMALGAPDHEGTAHVAAPHDHAAAPDCSDCDPADADMTCADMMGHCGPALSGGGAVGDVALAVRDGDRDLPANLSLTGAGPDFDTPPPRG